jgi:hypothetical protein
MSRTLTILLAAAPGLVLAAVGTWLHPAGLSAETARAWWQLHVWLIPVFPLISVVVLAVLRDERGPLAGAARLAAYGFACFYTGLDVLSGIGAGRVFEVQGDGPAVAALFEVGGWLGDTGVWCLLACAVLTGAALARRGNLWALPGAAVLAAACFPFRVGHIFHPTGVLAMIGIAIGCALLAAAPSRPRPVPVQNAGTTPVLTIR